MPSDQTKAPAAHRDEESDPAAQDPSARSAPAVGAPAGPDPALVRVAACSLEQAKAEVGLGARSAGAPLRRAFERVSLEKKP